MISVIIPVYNQEDSLHICLNSVLNQEKIIYEILLEKCVESKYDVNFTY